MIVQKYKISLIIQNQGTSFLKASKKNPNFPLYRFSLFCTFATSFFGHEEYHLIQTINT
jgi:hypothetical protein